MSTTSTRYAIGLDIGGTKTHAVLISDGRVAREAIAGSANTQSVDRKTAEANLRAVFNELGAPVGPQVCVGAAGVDTDADAERMRALIRSIIGADGIRIVHDSRLILAAAGLDAGISVIAGTGSVVWGTDGAKREARSGGWGYLLGDEGSGYWLAIQAVRHALRQMEAGGPADEMTAELLESCGVDEPAQLIHLAYSGADRRFWAERAPIVFDAADRGNAAARQIVESGLDAIADSVRRVSQHIGIPGPVVLAGGLATHRDVVVDGVGIRLGEPAGVRVLDNAPVNGTLRLLGDRSG